MATVLIVDDHSGFRSFARRVLERSGFDVVGEAPDGATAVAAIHDLRPDVVLLDVQLPDFDGFEVARRMAEDGSSSRIVLTSSRDAADYGSSVADSVAVGFIPKAELSGPRLRSALARND
jgi:DNA-binding NarL/FixJ family response regulator